VNYGSSRQAKRYFKSEHFNQSGDGGSGGKGKSSSVIAAVNLTDEYGIEAVSGLGSDVQDDRSDNGDHTSVAPAAANGSHVRDFSEIINRDRNS
jgi:hypothetical protein